MTGPRWLRIFRGFRDQLLNLANTTDGNGRYIFAGYKTDTAPFSEANGDYVSGTESISNRSMLRVRW